MFKKILVPTDGSALAEKAALAAFELAEKLDSTIVAVSVAEPYPYSPLYEGTSAIAAKDYEERAMAEAHSYVDRLKKMADDRHIKMETLVSQSFEPHKEIVDIAGSHQCDAIIMASHGRKGLSKVFLGSETQKVLAHTDIPVTVIH